MELRWKTCLRAGTALFVLWLATQYWAGAVGLLGLGLSASSPLLLGCVIAYVVNILMSFYERHLLKGEKHRRLRRPVCMVLAFITIAMILFILVRMILPELLNCVGLLLEEIPKAINAVFAFLEENYHISSYLQGDAKRILTENQDWQTILERALSAMLTGVGGAVNAAVGFLSGLFGVLVTGIISTIFSIYLLGGKERICSQVRRLFTHFLPGKLVGKIGHVYATVNDCFRKYIVGQCTEAVILGLLCIIGLLVMRMPYAAMVGSLVGATALIPVAGAWIGAGVGAFMIFTVSPVQALIFLGFILVLQQLENNLIYPRVVGTSIGLPGVWVLTAVTIGGGMLGVAGMLLGVPLAAAVYQLLKERVNRAETETNE